MAERGGQPGNDNATKNKLWADTLRRALLADDGRKLRALAEKLIARAEEGDTSALREIGDRIDGKPTQQIEASGPEGGAIPHSLTVEFVGASQPASKA